MTSARMPSGMLITKIYGHEATESTAAETVGPIADELATNPFLRAGEPAVRAAAEAHAGRQLDGEVAVFAALRAWKNVHQ